MVKFYDTCSLLNLQQKIFDDYFYISTVSIQELENIKTSGTRDEEIRWAARKLLHLLKDNEGKYDIIQYSNSETIKQLNRLDLSITNDNIILITAKNLYKYNKDFLFCTSDLSCYMMAKYFLEIPAYFMEDNVEDSYTGFKIQEFTEETLANFYNETIAENQNIFGLLENEYLLVKYEDKIVDKYKWVGDHYKKVNFLKSESKMFGKITPKDDYQQLALDSLNNNQITMLKGSAGTGKSYLAFGYMFEKLEQEVIDKIIIFCNTVATKGSAKLGFYPGSRTEKLLDSQIGNLLESKLGDRFIVEDLIAKGKLVLLPLSDIRGYDTSGMNAIIYISEAQNMDIELMRLSLQRIGEDSKCIIDGDYSHQVDMTLYAGTHNGMRRASEVFRGHPCYGEVTLQTIYRSEIGKIAESL